jgi:membrane associated rhomboid family serine protease
MGREASVRPVIPLKDENPTRRRAVVTLVLMALNIGIYFQVQPDVDDFDDSATFTYEYAAIPCEVVTNEPLSPEENVFTNGGVADRCNEVPEGPPIFPDKSVWLAVLFSMFFHGSFMHLAGNMLFLWVFGNNIEDHLGVVKYVAFYLVGGIVATLAHVFVQPDSTIPLVGASGAVAAVMGAYLVWFPNVRVHTLFFFFLIMFRDISAKWLLLIWFGTQFLDYFNPNSGVAWMAHVGCFVFGMAVGALVRASRPARQLAWTHDYDRF